MESHFDFSIRVRYAETDRMGVVYHGSYATYFEVGRSEFMRDKGYPYRELEEKGYGLVVVGVEIKYYKPAHYDDLLVVRTSVADVRSRGVSFDYTVMRDDTTIVVGKTRHICVTSDGKTTRLPPFITEILKNAVPT